MLDKWRLSFERKGLIMNRKKTEYIEYDFGRRDQEVDETRIGMTISGDVIG